MRRYLNRWCLCLSSCLAMLSPAQAQTIDSREPSPTLPAVMARLQHVPRGQELPVDELAMDPNVRPRNRVSSAAAAIDVERFFHLLEHGYCGYGFFSQEHSFDIALAEILAELRTREHWRTRELAELIRRRLDFVIDCHLRLGPVQFAGHHDFWFCPDLEVTEREGTYYTGLAEDEQTIISVNGLDPAGFVYRSLDSAGLPVHLLGSLSLSEPEPLRVVTKVRGATAERRYIMQRSDHKRSDLFRRFRLGGLPVVRISTFSDHHTQQLEDFLRAADELRGEPCVILDIRRNGGGNTRWPREWIERFTGWTPDLNQVLSELVSRTALVGQSNYMAWLAAGPGWTIRAQIAEERDRLAARVKAFDDGAARPYWIAPYLPRKPPIPNETTLVVIIDRAVASSGEGLISFLQDQVENVVLVGENTRGALTFGHASAHRLPNSRLMAQLPVKLNVPLDLVWREERGFDPDYWVPAEDALNRAVGAIRAGTIRTAKPLSAAVMAAEFVPETPLRFSRAEIRRYLQILMVVVVGAIAGLVNRKRRAPLFVLLAAGLAFGAYAFDENPAARTLAVLLACINAAVAVYKIRRSFRDRADRR